MIDGFRKIYTQEEDRRYDQPAREACKRYFADCPHLKVVDNKNQYGIDLDLYQNDKFVRHIETETKTDYRWTSDLFPFPDVNFLARKLDHLVSRKFDYSAQGLWVLWNEDYSQHLVVTLEDVLSVYRARLDEFGEKQALVEVPNRVQRDQQSHVAEANREKEYFLKLPLRVAHMNGLITVKRKYNKP